DGVDHLALETSSHALAQRRVDAVSFEAGVFTRVSSEHLDYHGTWEDYLAAKLRLAAMVAEHPRGLLVADADDEPVARHLRDVAQPFAVVVDSAPAAAALGRVLGELRAATRGRLWVVFGSAGERDLVKRPAMGGVAARLADAVVLTDEDPRGEDRSAILEAIAAGARAAGGRDGDGLWLIPDRAVAIAFAVAGAAPGDTVLLAGKGHEASIIGPGGAVPWDERGAAEAAVRDRLARDGATS